MVNIFIMTGLLIMGITDIKRKAVPLWMLIIFSIFSIIIKVIFNRIDSIFRWYENGIRSASDIVVSGQRICRYIIVVEKS